MRAIGGRISLGPDDRVVTFVSRTETHYRRGSGEKAIRWVEINPRAPRKRDERLQSYQQAIH